MAFTDFPGITDQEEDYVLMLRYEAARALKRGDHHRARDYTREANMLSEQPVLQMGYGA